MRRLVLIALMLAGCGTTAAPGPVVSAPDNANDCAVIAAVARDHYHFNTTDHLPPPLWLRDGDRAWSPHCDWGRYGLAFPRTYAPDTPRHPGERTQWVQFERPTYDGQGAVVKSGILFGPLAGNGIECRVRSGFAGWTTTECKTTWIS